MNKKETTQILTILASNYKFFNEQMTEEGKSDILVMTWQSCFEDMTYELVANAVKQTVITSKYPPTVCEIRKQAIEIVDPCMQKTGIEAWNEAYKMICNGTHMTQEEFEKHSKEVQRFFGSVNQLKAYATNEDFNMDVVRSNFLKQYDILVNREKEQKLLPQQMQEFRKQLAQKNEHRRVITNE